MPTHQEILDAGTPVIPENGDMTETLRYAAALRGLYQSAAAMGTWARRAPSEVTAAVASHTATLPSPGAVTAVYGEGGSSGAKTIRPVGTPAAGEVTVAYDADDIPTLTFAAGDAITSTTVHQLQVPAGLIEHLKAEAE